MPRVPLIPASLLESPYKSSLASASAREKEKTKENTHGTKIDFLSMRGSRFRRVSLPARPIHPSTSLPGNDLKPRRKKEKGGEKRRRNCVRHTAARVAVPRLHPRDAVNSGQTCKPRRVRVGVPGGMSLTAYLTVRHLRSTSLPPSPPPPHLTPEAFHIYA